MGRDSFQQEKEKEKNLKSNNELLKKKCKKCDDYCIGITTVKGGKNPGKPRYNNLCDRHYSEYKQLISKMRIRKKNLNEITEKALISGNNKISFIFITNFNLRKRKQWWRGN